MVNDSPDEKNPNVCNNDKFITLHASDGHMRRFRCRCSRTDDCKVCNNKRAVKLYARLRYAIEAMKNPKFLTITLHPDHLPVGSTLEAKIDAISGNLWKSFRKNWLQKLCGHCPECLKHGKKKWSCAKHDHIPVWCRVWEFGNSGDYRPHMHLFIDDPDYTFPNVFSVKNKFPTSSRARCGCTLHTCRTGLWVHRHCVSVTSTTPPHRGRTWRSLFLW